VEGTHAAGPDHPCSCLGMPPYVPWW
jgi:hypothetical protein